MQIAPYLSLQSSTDTTLEAFRHNPTDVASFPCSLEQVLCHWSVPAVSLVLCSNAVATRPSFCCPCVYWTPRSSQHFPFCSMCGFPTWQCPWFGSYL